MQNNSINLPILDISLTDRIGMLMEREPSIASGLAKYQQETINKISQSLGYSRKDVLEGICLYYTKREKTKIAITYANMYINETDVTADDLAKVFRVIVDSLLITTTPERFAEKKMPRGMGKFMKKADSFGEKDSKGIVAFMQGRVFHLFRTDYEKANQYYQKSYKQGSQEAYNVLGKALQGMGLMKDALVVQSQGWEKYQDIQCLGDMIRLLFILEADKLAYYYYQILKEVNPETPHLVALSHMINVSQQSDLIKDYFRGLHFQEYTDSLPQQSHMGIVKWTLGYIEKIDKKRIILKEKIEVGPLNISADEYSQYEELFYNDTLELLDYLYFGAIGLLDEKILVLYMQNISTLLDEGDIGRELLIRHIEYTKPYSAYWEETQMLQEEGEKEDEEEGENEEKNEDGEADISSDSGDEEDFDVNKELMGILDMIIAHYSTYEDMDILEWYTITAQKVLIDDLDSEELEEYTMKLEADIIFEKKMFLGMPDALQSWYEELRERVDQTEGVFFRKKIQCMHRASIPLKMTLSKDIMIFAIVDGLISGVEESVYVGYIDKLEGMDVSSNDALHICNICFHFGCSELAFILLGSNIIDWKNPETLFLAVRLIYSLSNRDRKVREEIIMDIEEYIKRSGYEITDMKTFIMSTISDIVGGNIPFENQALLQETGGLIIHLSGDIDNADTILNLAHKLGSYTALPYLSTLYMFEGEYEKAYQILHSVYDAEDPRMLMETANLLELAIRTERRKEAKELLKIMGKNSISRIIPLHFHYSITGTISEELEAISLLGIYDDKTLSELDTFALQFVVDKRESFLMAEHISDHIFLTCKRSMVFFPSKDIPKAIEYWEILQDFIKTQKFTALSEHLRPFVNEDLFSSIDYENKDESEITSGYIEAVISAEAHLFRARFIKDPSLIFLLDTIAETFMLLSDGSPLADLWYEEAQKNANAKNAFDLQYDMGRFGQKPVFH